jgi:hypothetical protein
MRTQRHEDNHNCGVTRDKVIPTIDICTITVSDSNVHNILRTIKKLSSGLMD